MSAEANIDLVCAWVEQVGRRVTIEEIELWHVRTRATFPDIHYTINDLFATDDRVALRWTATATHRGTLWGMIPPTGRTITWTGMHLLRLAGDRIIEIWALQNGVAQLRQMGVTLLPARDSAE